MAEPTDAASPVLCARAGAAARPSVPDRLDAARGPARDPPALTAVVGAVAPVWAAAGRTAALATSATPVRPTVRARSAPGRERPLVGGVDRLESTLQLLRHRCDAPGRTGSGSCWCGTGRRPVPPHRRTVSGRRAP